MWIEIGNRISELESSDVDVIVLRGSNGVFSSGADIKEMLEFAESGRAQEYQNAVNYCFKMLDKTNKITISLIEGYALGGGIMVALMTDIRIAEENAKIGIPLVKLGLAVEPYGIKRLIETAGIGFAKEFLMTGDIIPKEKLLASCLVNYIVKSEEIETFTINMITKLLKENGIEAIKKTKTIIKEFLNNNPCEAFLEKVFATLMESEEFKERAKKFILKPTK